MSDGNAIMEGDKSKRIYVTVESVFDQTGYMQPVSITLVPLYSSQIVLNILLQNI